MHYHGWHRRIYWKLKLDQPKNEVKTKDKRTEADSEAEHEVETHLVPGRRDERAVGPQHRADASDLRLRISTHV